jgi:hypothetical protein
MRNILKKTHLLAFVFFLLFNLTAAGAANLKDGFGDNTVGKFAEQAGYNKSSTNSSSFNTMIGLIIKAFLSLLGVVFLFLMIYGGWVYMTAQGSEQKVDEALRIIRTAIIGLIIILAAYAISYFVFSSISSETLTTQ